MPGTAPPYFYETVPTVSIRGDIAYFAEDEDRRACMRMATALEFYRSFGVAIEGWHREQGAQIITLSSRGPLFLREYREG